jgi:hypothetical protein
MEPKSQAIFDELMKVFPEGNVEYFYGNDLHKFRLEREGPSQWLYVSREFVDDHTAQEIIMRFSGLQISEAFRGSPCSLWLFLSEAGVREVDGNFCRDY